MDRKVLNAVVGKQQNRWSSVCQTIVLRALDAGHRSLLEVNEILYVP